MSARLRVGRVGAMGLGVFARSAIEEGTVVVRFRGRPRWIWDIPRWQWEHLFQVGYDLYVVPKVGSNGWSINHSCEPNCAVRGERSIVAMRRIEKGEELNFDYSTNVGWDGYALQCRCGSRHCRGTITSYSKLTEAWKRKYDGRISPFLLSRPKSVRPTLF